MSPLSWLVLTRSAAENSTRLVAVTLALLADAQGRGEVPTATLLQLTRCSPRTLRSALRQLTRLGEIKAVTAGGVTRYVWLVADSADLRDAAGGGS